MQKITDRQRMVLEFICESIDDRGYPPTLREIGLKLGIRSTNGVNDHLRALERKGYLTREDMKSRTLRPTPTTLDLVGRGPANGAAPRNGARPGNGSSASALHSSSDDDMLEIPIVGRVAAGALQHAIEHPQGTVKIDRVLLGKPGGDVFGLKISGDSMIEAGIFDGDYVFVRKQLEAQKGAIVVALVGDEATCKYYFPEADRVRLEPANARYQPIYVRRDDWRESSILGVVVGVYRKV